MVKFSAFSLEKVSWYIWSGDSNESRLITVAGIKCVALKLEGGLCFRNFYDLNVAALMRFGCG